MAEDQTLEETPTDESPKETSEETAEVKETPQEKTEPEVDYKVKFRESQKEAVRLSKELKELKITVKPAETVETDTGGETLDQIVDKKVQERFAPLNKQQEEERVDKWLNKNPDGYDYLKQIEENWQAIPGKTIEEKLENSLLLAKKDAMKQAGKKEMAFSIYQKEQASTSGGGISTPTGEGLPELSEEEKKVAQAFGIKEEIYAKNKLNK